MRDRKQPNGRRTGAERKAVVLIAGPTGSGKSALAARLAARLAGTIINADSMQVYADLPILTACPTMEEQAQAPHRLYGVLPGRRRCSVGWWRAQAVREIDAALALGRVPIVTGGTGLYLKALIEGIAAVPEVPAETLAAGQEILDRDGVAALHAVLAVIDARAAAAIRPSDPQRLLRAWAVKQFTGRSLYDWQDDQKAQAACSGYDFLPFVLLPDRRDLYPACDARFVEMLERGAIAEVEKLLTQAYDSSLPVMKAVGVREIAAWLSGDCDHTTMVQRGQMMTRRYAKRQFTWFRNQSLQNTTFFEKFSESIADNIFSKIRHFRLTSPS